MIKRKCKQCGKEFVLSDSEIKFFNDKNLELPKRCSECRKENKNNNKEYNIENSKSEKINNNKDNIHKNYKSDSKKKTFRNIIAAGLVLIVLLLGKLFNIDINWQEIRTNFGTQENNVSLEFRNETLWEDHFEKHGSEFGYKSKEEYLKGANEVINSSTSKHKTEAEDGDEIYYDEEKNEIVFVSTDGYIRTYFKPKDGINYYNRQ
ncbi:MULTISPECIES: zinc-ribbon domain containing protein [Clostridia]|uniref:Zinc-ribbon domain containing protein n=1 Tax=Clostridium saudiense TaxID=1414720 RepID=A0ABS2FH38_9CLOT|nr:zinc-ribbon domain containing protein [Paraclostridium bifermentans]MBM6819769.1 zinc-ribbon domain containing protein [Clostridium saudiense]